MPRNKLINLYTLFSFEPLTTLAQLIEEETDIERLPQFSKVTQITNGRWGI